MLVCNPIYKELFNIGYKGRENPYMYWKRNENRFFEHLKEKRKDLLDDVNIVKAFHAKLRWRSPIGMLLAFELSRIIPKFETGTQTDLLLVKVEYGKTFYTLSDFSTLYPVRCKMDIDDIQSACDTFESVDGTDVRGLGLYWLNVVNLAFKNTDFRYATISCSELKNVRFSKCRMDFMEIRRSELTHSFIDEYCTLANVDLTDTLVEVEFKCKIINPVVSRVRKKDVRKLLIGYNPRWRAFTEVRGDSFCAMVNDDRLVEYIVKKQKKLESIYAICESGIIGRGVALAKTFV